MHVGYPEDRGGNDHKLKFSDGTLTNMHSVWDGQIIEHMDSLYGEEYLYNNVSIKIDKFLKNPHLQNLNLGRKKVEILQCNNQLVIAIMS
jgi:hypothetical protein